MSPAVSSDTIRGTFLKLSAVASMIRWIGDPALTTRCSPITLQQLRKKTTRDSGQQLVDTLQNIRSLIGIGRGLAAPQIGLSQRMIAIFYNDEYSLLVNPRVTRISAQLATYPEMCLSSLPLAADVIRPFQVQVEYLTTNGQARSIWAEPMLSRLLQHEIDHLDGVLFIAKAQLGTLRFVDDFDQFVCGAKLVQL